MRWMTPGSFAGWAEIPLPHFQARHQARETGELERFALPFERLAGATVSVGELELENMGLS
jgi:hypothetical protein